jgi:protocatechuate 3,4-dioxygenase beta subunit
VSGKDGRARLGPIAPGSATLSARADGYVPRGSMVVAGEGEMIVPLAKAGVLLGRVVDRRGDAIDGATIEIIGTDFYGAPVSDDPRRLQFREAHFEAMLPGPRPLVPAGELGVMPGPVPPIPRVGGFSTPDRVSRPIAEDPWVTKRDGTFRCTPATPGRIRALVRHPQYVEAVSDVVTLNAGGEATVTVVMSAGGALEGRVLDHRGHAVSGARVSIAATRGTLERSARTASDGTFAFASVPESITVSVSSEEDPTQIAARQLVQVPDGGKKEITITLPAPRDPVDVRVRDDRGYPLDAAQVTAHSLDPDSPLRVTAFTNARGEARLSNARGLHARIEVNASGQAPKIITLDAVPAALDITLDEAESASGEVRSTRGDRLESAEVVLYTSAGARHARTIADGSFTVKDLAPGPARLRVRAKGYAPSEKDVEIPASRGKRTHDLRRIELAPEGIVEGVVLDERGDPVQGARIAKDRVPTYLAVGGTPPGVAVTDARGRFKLTELPEGIITLEAFMPDVGRVRHEAVRVTAGRSTVDVRITLKKDAKGYDPASSGGVAVTLGESQGEVVIAQVAESSEAERAGLQPGDVIEDVDGVKVKTIEEARAKLNGPLADDVVLRVKRSDKHETVRLAREPVRR